jgi:hypothetical protein
MKVIAIFSVDRPFIESEHQSTGRNRILRIHIKVYFNATMAEMKYEDSDQLDVGYDDTDHRHRRKPTNVLSQLEKSEVGRAKEQQTFISAVSNNLAIGINDVNKKYFNFCFCEIVFHAHDFFFSHC